jgi:AbrB family looped-hinge helix DNA binding protein
MITTIDKAGRIVVPKEIREELHFSPHSELEIIKDGIEIRIRKKHSPSLKVEKKSNFLLLDFEGEIDLSKTLQDLREERILSFL